MSSETKFRCNFCRGTISPEATKQGARGYCLDSFEEWTNKINMNLSGPHICEVCVKALTQSLAYSQVQ